MKIILSTLCIALLALFAYQVMSFPLDADEGRGKINNNELVKSIDYDLPQLAVLNRIDDYSEIIQRPLFAKDRAAAASIRSVNKVTTVNELAHLILVGTASSTDVQIAIIADTKAKQMERLKVGESYKDWNIAEVSSDHVVFQNSELEYKLFVAPIKGSQKDKQAKLIGQINKNEKIDKATAAIKSYSNWKGASKNNARSVNNTDSYKVDEAKNNIANRSWGYNKKYSQSNSNNKGSDNTKSTIKPVKRSPIKIPGVEEKDAAYYEAEDDNETSASSQRTNITREITAEDYYDDEDITEDELKALEGLGAKIFVD